VTEKEQLSVLCAEYVLGTLEGKERARLEGRIASGDPEVLGALAEAQGVVAQLGVLADEQAPPDSLKNRLMAEVARTRQRGDVLEMPAPPPRRPLFQIPAFGWAAVAAMLILSVYIAWQSRELNQQMQTLQADLRREASRNSDLQKEREQFEQTLAILSDPSAREFSLKPAGAAVGQPALVTAKWKEGAGIVLTAAKLPAPAPGRALQLWVVPKRGDPIPAGVFRPDASGRGVLLSVEAAAHKMADAAALALTEEPAGGSPKPTTQPTWVAALP